MEIIEAKSINLEKLSYGASKETSMMSLLPIKYNNKFFVLNFPKMYLDSDLKIIGEKKYLILSFRGITNNHKIKELYENINKLDEKYEQKLNSIESNNIESNNIESNNNPITIKYVPSIKEEFIKFKKSYPTIKLYITEETKFYNSETGELLNDEYNFDDIIKSYREITCLVYFKYIWSSILQSGCYLELLEAKIKMD
jgi:hypothetical protein